MKFIICDSNRFLLSSEAYGILNSNKSLYFDDKLNCPFRPKRYETQRPANNDIADFTHQSQKHEFSEAAKFHNFSDFVRDHDAFHKINDDVKHTVSQAKAIANGPHSGESDHLKRAATCPLIKPSRSTEAAPPSPDVWSPDQKVSKDSSVESLRFSKEENPRIAKEKAENLALKHEWHNPHKKIIKPLIQV